MNRAIFYIDGFNLYHSLTSASHKWLDLRKLSEAIVSTKEELSGIKYFSALCPWDLEKRQRHMNLIDIYENSKIQVFLGRFKQIEATCNKPGIRASICDRRYQRYTEKQTDVNIASQLLRDAYEERIEKAYILSRDSDLIPAIKILREMKINTMVVFPPKTQEVEELKKVCGQHRVLKVADIEKALLSNSYLLPSGQKIERPPTWF